MTTYGDFFTGFGGVTIGAIEAGLDVHFGVEYDAKLAAVYRQNLGDHVIVADVTTLEVSTLPYVDIFHASPPCTNASVANANAGESPLDMAMATAVCRYIVVKRPQIFTLENVYMYRTFESWHMIARTLLDEGYTYNYWHVNMADYGVPQTRKRMIVIARRDGKTPMLPEATHAKSPQTGLFGTLKKWMSWYEAVEDLIPTLPDSQFAPWQLKRLPAELKASFLPHTQANSNTDGRYSDQPSTTIAPGKIPGRALLVHGTNGNGITANQKSQPAAVVVSSLHSKAAMPKAFIVDGANANSKGKDKHRASELSAKTIAQGNGMPRAWLPEKDKGDYSINHRDDSSPAQGVTTSDTRRRAFLADRINAGSGKQTTRMEDEPALTMTCYTPKHQEPNAYANGRVVKMTPRAIARFQSFPDWYKLPDWASLSVKGIGNAVPPLFAEKLYESLVTTL